MEKLKDTIPYSVFSSIEVALRLSIKETWKWRKDIYWRNETKKSIAALKFIRNN